MKTGIFTGRTLDPVHPRLDSYLAFFKKHNIEYDILPPVNHNIFSRFNWLALWFFDLYSVHVYRKKIMLYDIVFIHDLKFLPLAVYAKRKKKIVIYETLDNNVSLRLYQLNKKLPVTRLFNKLISGFFSGKEKRIAFNFCDKIIVNSKTLLGYFENRADLIYYSSSFENIQAKNNPDLNPALIYLGEFSDEKGAAEVITLQQKLGIELYIFGTIRSRALSGAISGNKLIHHTDRISHKELVLKLTRLTEKYYLAGTSFIRPIHYSYATQEANKDIDYLSVGIPIIGNHRLPTEEKILSGCGIFQEDEMKLKQLLADKSFRKELTVNCTDYYYRHYSEAICNKGIAKVFSDFTDIS